MLTSVDAGGCQAPTGHPERRDVHIEAFGQLWEHLGVWLERLATQRVSRSCTGKRLIPLSVIWRKLEWGSKR